MNHAKQLVSNSIDMVDKKVQSFYHEKDWALIWQTYRREQIGQWSEFMDYVEGIREPELAMVRRAEMCAKQRQSALEKKSAWVEQRMNLRKRSYTQYQHEYGGDRPSKRPSYQSYGKQSAGSGKGKGLATGSRPFKNRLYCFGCRRPNVTRPNYPTCNKK